MTLSKSKELAALMQLNEFLTDLGKLGIQYEITRIDGKFTWSFNSTLTQVDIEQFEEQTRASRKTNEEDDEEEQVGAWEAEVGSSSGCQGCGGGGKCQKQ